MLRAGFAKADITTSDGAVHDPLYARVLALSDGVLNIGTLNAGASNAGALTAAVVSVDTICFGGGISNEPMFIELVKEAVEEKFATALAPAIPVPEVVVCKYQSDANLVGAVYNFMQVVEGVDYIAG